MAKKKQVWQASGYIAANGLQIFYESVGQGQPLILLHGGSATLAMWRGLVPRLAQHFQVIAIDNRGHGKTDNPTGKMTYRLMADDVAAFIKVTGLVKPFLCGYSDGGQILLELGMNYPNLARALVIGGAYRELTEERKQAFAAMAMPGPGLVDFATLLQHGGGYVEAYRKAHGTPADPERWRTMFLQLSECWYEPMNHTRTDLQRIQEPVLLLIGDRDEFITVEENVAMYRDLAKGELVVIPNGTHGSTVGRSNLFDPALLLAGANSVFEQAVIDFCHRHSAAG